mmetsp:Transcript_24872/g.39042  ORF Transcript_24872/g.39042 Transcript_24872/m.39042 type:complete len:388 (-) Transcript_24872:60-1223(-)
MVSAESTGYGSSTPQMRSKGALQAQNLNMKLLAAALAVTAVVAVAVFSQGAEEPRTELLTDSVSIANKILASQKFKKADTHQQKHEIKKMLSKDLEHKSGATVVSKIAKIAATKHESYHERMEEMRKLLDAHTADIQASNTPGHAKAKKSARGRKPKSKAQEAADNAKAIRDAKKLLVHSASKQKGQAKTLKASTHDKKVHDETSKTAANPKEAQSWMQKQLTAGRASPDKVKAAVKHTAKALMSEKKAIKEGEQLMKRESLKHSIKHKLSMSSKDQKIHKASQKAHLKPSDEAKFFKSQVAAKKHAVKHAAASKMSKQQKLLKWAEAHGLPKKLADNPKDQAKVKDIIARMKADAVVERIKNQMKADDASVGGIIKGADHSAAGAI